MNPSCCNVDILCWVLFIILYIFFAFPFRYSGSAHVCIRFEVLELKNGGDWVFFGVIGESW